MDANAGRQQRMLPGQRELTALELAVVAIVTMWITPATVARARTSGSWSRSLSSSRCAVRVEQFKRHGWSPSCRTSHSSVSPTY